MAPIYFWLYGQDPDILINGRVHIQSEQGSQQGDGFAPLGFTMPVMAIANWNRQEQLQKQSSVSVVGFSWWYFDDNITFGTPQGLFDFYSTLDKLVDMAPGPTTSG